VVGRADRERPGNDIVQVYIQRSLSDSALSKENDESRRQSLVEFCRANMAPYKVPKEIFFVDALPLTSVGKIDKKVLRAKQVQAQTEPSLCEANV
jgi:long-chain acyl-CoA synthetase